MNLDNWFTENPDWRPFADLVVYPLTPPELQYEFPDISQGVVDRCYELLNHGGLEITVSALYTKIRRCGASEQLAAMLALQSPPRLKSNVTFLTGRKPWYEHADARYVEKIKTILKSKGVAITPRMEYMPELARFPGDPEAVLPHGQERDHIKKICETRGWACEGAVECKHREPERDPHESAPKMAEDLIRNKARLLASSDPSFKRKSRQEQRAAVLAKFGPSK